MTSKVIRSLICMVAVLVLSGCSIVEFAYNRADWFAMNYADELVELNESQQALLKIALKARLETHRAEELPDYITYTQDAGKLFAEGVDEREVTELIDALRALYDKAAIRTAGSIAPTIASLSSEQRRELAASFAEKNAEFEHEYLAPDPDKRAEDRMARLQKRIKHWTGSLSDSQLTLLDQGMADSVDVTPLWFAYRKRQQKALLESIEQGADAAAIEQRLINWWVTQADVDEQSRIRSQRWIEQQIALFVVFDQTLSVKQREHVLERLMEYEEMFVRLHTHTEESVSTEVNDR